MCVDGDECDVILVEASDDGDVDGVLSAHGDGELAFPDGGAHAEIHLGEHILGREEIIAVPEVAYLQMVLVYAVLEVDLLKIIGGPPYGGRSLPCTCLETAGVVIRDSVDDDIGVVVFCFSASITDPV